MKRRFSIMLCAVIILLSFGFCISAEQNNLLSLSDATGNPGDTVIVSVNYQGSDMFSQIGFGLKFNKSALEYRGYYNGVLNDYNVFEHNNKGYISFSSIQKSNIEKAGNIVSFEFYVKDNAKSKDYNVSLFKVKCLKEDGNKVKLKKESGTVTVKSACAGDHDYGNFEKISTPGCTSFGVNARYCKNCGHSDIEMTEPKGHSLEETYTIDVIAQDGRKGLLSRHCTVCGAMTNIIIYDETSNSALSINDVINSLDEDSLDNLIYFLNGSKVYPEISAEDFDGTVSAIENETVIYSDKFVNVKGAIDTVLKRFFGNDKNSGVFGYLKRAELAGEISLKSIGKLITLVFF